MLQLRQRNIYLRYSFCNNGLLFETCAVELDGTRMTILVDFKQDSIKSQLLYHCVQLSLWTAVVDWSIKSSNAVQ